MTKNVPSADDGKPTEDARAGDQPLSAVAQRALEEAATRRLALDDATANRPKEIAGRSGPEPVRYGDWEVKGLASDF